MNKLIFTLLALASLTATSCNRSADGNYIVYKVTSNHWGLGTNSSRDTIFNYLKGKMLSAKYKIAYANDFVTLTSLKDKSELVLAKSVTRDGNTIYSDEVQHGVAKYKFELKKLQDTLTLAVDMQLPINEPMFDMVQYGGSLNTSIKSNNVVCYLSKVD